VVSAAIFVCCLGLPVNLLGLLYGAMLINFAWPRAASNPTPTQSGVLHLGFLNGIPILWTVFALVIVIGAVYYVTVGRTKQFAALVTPAGDDAPLVAEAAAPQEG
jgi:hypothetical protein